jgi:nicotinate phosphoribosyltransferase
MLYKAKGIRLDSGDLAYLSNQVRDMFKRIASIYPNIDWYQNMSIVASNDIDEDILHSLNIQVLANFFF